MPANDLPENQQRAKSAMGIPHFKIRTGLTKHYGRTNSILKYNLLQEKTHCSYFSSTGAKSERCRAESGCHQCGIRISYAI
eukprot:6191460-Pleurochrysis_carterae.AAC.2